jgi:holo-[acyl-carrier protein] synthase
MIVGVGVDVVDMHRIQEVLKRQGERFLERVYTPGERSFCRDRRDPTPHLAARFAAKEAVFKALGTGWAKGVTWVDIEVCRQGQEAPFLILHGEAKRMSESLGVRRTHLSLSHSETAAVAVVILES